MEKPTVIVADQASVHTSDAIQDQIEEWQERNISLFLLPTYSPHLNLIEICGGLLNTNGLKSMLILAGKL